MTDALIQLACLLVVGFFAALVAGYAVVIPLLFIADVRRQRRAAR